MNHAVAEQAFRGSCYLRGIAAAAAIRFWDTLAHRRGDEIGDIESTNVRRLRIKEDLEEITGALYERVCSRAFQREAGLPVHMRRPEARAFAVRAGVLHGLIAHRSPLGEIAARYDAILHLRRLQELLALMSSVQATGVTNIERWDERFAYVRIRLQSRTDNLPQLPERPTVLQPWNEHMLAVAFHSIVEQAVDASAETAVISAARGLQAGGLPPSLGAAAMEFRSSDDITPPVRDSYFINAQACLELGTTGDVPFPIHLDADLPPFAASDFDIHLFESCGFDRPETAARDLALAAENMDVLPGLTTNSLQR